jgi:hypothetical protein
VTFEAAVEVGIFTFTSAEVDAVNQALHAGSQLEDLVLGPPDQNQVAAH